MDDLNDLSFEEAMNKLEEIVKLLEEGKLPLEQSIQTFEVGTNLKKYCSEKLANAELKIENIQKNSVEKISLDE